MEWTTRRITVSLLVLSLALGLTSFLASVWPAVAEPIGVTPLPPVVETDGRAGACYSFYYDPPEGPDRPFVQMALDAGSRWDRFDFIWPNIEPADDIWNFGAYDVLVDDLDAAGMNVVGILLWTPDWAATGGVTGLSLPDFDRRPLNWYAPVLRNDLTPLAVSAASAPPQGLYLPWDDPNNHWGDFVYEVVSRYGDRVKHWEMWNEPEWPYFWTGTSTDYAQLLKVGYQATKSACSDCTVLFGGLHYWMNPSFYRWVLRVLDDDPTAAQNNHFFDVMSVHLYSRSSSTYDEVNNIRSGMSAYDVGDHPIWLTETGVPVWDDASVDPDPTRYDFAATQDEAAAYVIQSYANGLASDVGRYFFFRTHDADMTEYFGLIRNDHSLRLAYVAYQVAATYLISPTFATRELTGSHRGVTLWGTPRGKVSVLWNETPFTSVYTLPAAVETAMLVDRWGITETITPTRGIYTFTLPGATAFVTQEVAPGVFERDYFIGGDPLIVLESETVDEPPTSTVHPLPEMTPATTFTVTWEGRDNQSGIWHYDVQARDGAGGGWTDWRSTTVTSSQFTGEYGHTYYFRSRATDRVGNREAWPEVPQAHTTLNLSATLWVSVGTFFADENRNGLWDDIITGTGSLIFEEITLTQVSLRLLDGFEDDVVTPVVTGPWAFTTTIYYTGRPYRLWATSADGVYVRVVPITGTWARSGEVYTRTYDVLGLWPVTRLHLPLVLRERDW